MNLISVRELKKINGGKRKGWWECFWILKGALKMSDDDPYWRKFKRECGRR